MKKLTSYFSSLAITFVLCVSLASAQQMEEDQVLPVENTTLPMDMQIDGPFDPVHTDDLAKQIGDPFEQFDEPLEQIDEPSDTQIAEPPKQVGGSHAQGTEPEVPDTVNCLFFPIKQPGEAVENFTARIEAYRRHCTPKTPPER